jgi:hypothetical protein
MCGCWRFAVALISDWKPLSADCSQLRLQHLHCDVAFVAEVARKKHRRHPALTRPALDAVAAAQRRVQALHDDHLRNWTP